jgi:hypothetical protein
MVGPGRRYAERPFTSRPLIEPYSNDATVLSKLTARRSPPSPSSTRSTMRAPPRPSPAFLSDVTLTAKAEDADTVTISTKAADPVLPLRLASPVLGVLSAKADGKDGTVSPVGTGTGPFEITKLTGKSRATFARCASAGAVADGGADRGRGGQARGAGAGDEQHGDRSSGVFE